MNETTSQKLSRREFIGAGTTASLMILNSRLVRGTAANSAVQVGILGCGARGNTDGVSLVNNTPARVVALGDLFADQLAAAKQRFDELARQKNYAGISAEQLFLGPKAYEELAGSKEVEAVVIATPPYYHPEHLEAVVAAGKHVYLEKPVSVDVHGAQRVIQAGEKLRGRSSLDVGFQIRHAPPFVELVSRIHGGAIGRVACGQAYYDAITVPRPPWPKASPPERRLRNWLHDRVLSGDIMLEMAIHVVDICNWTLQEHPLKAYGAGGRKVRTDQGDCWDDFELTYLYPNETRLSLNAVQFLKGWWDVGIRFFGTQGVSEAHYAGDVRILGEQPWDSGLRVGSEGQHFAFTGAFAGALKDADSEKHKAFVESITSGKFHNEARLGAESALSAILGRTAAYTSKETTWEELLRSDEAWDAGIDLNRLV
jgi:predicted dehydrogenase